MRENIKQKLCSSMCKATEENGAAMFIWVFHGKPYQQCINNFYLSVSPSVFGATHDILPSSSNLLCWHITWRHHVYRKQVCTTAHIPGACTVALQWGFFTFCHKSVLSVLADALKSFLSSKKGNNVQRNPSNLSKLVLNC